MKNVLRFEEYKQLNEVYSAASFGDVWRTLKPFGWTYRHSNGGDNITFTYNGRSANGHLKHGNSSDWNRKVDPETLDRIRDILIADFEKNGNPTMINAIPWEQWCSAIKDPFKSRLKDYDPETGKLKSEIEQLSKITFVEQLFKNVGVIQNDEGEYNLCKSESDLKPLLDRWYPLYKPSKDLNGKMCLGYEVDDLDGEEEFGEHLFEIKDNGTLGKTRNVDYVVESLSPVLGNVNTREEKTDFGTVWYYDAEDGSFRFAVYQYDDDSDTLYFSNLFVSEDKRGQGTGNVILKQIDDIAKEKGVSTICLRVKKDSFVRSWYERNGYTYIEDDQEEPEFVWMNKQIS